MTKSNLILVDTESIDPAQIKNIDILSTNDIMSLYKNIYTNFNNNVAASLQKQTRATINIANIANISKTPIYENIKRSLDTLRVYKHIYNIFILSKNDPEKFNISYYLTQNYNIQIISDLSSIPEKETRIYPDKYALQQKDLLTKMICVSLDLNDIDPIAFTKNCYLNICVPDKNHMKEKINMKKYVFIDTENVGPAGFDGCEYLKTGDMLKIYKSKACENLVDKILKEKNDCIEADVSISNVQFTMKNAMDCMIIHDICNLRAYRHLYDFYIITKDSDYVKPAKELSKDGYDINILSSVKQIPGLINTNDGRNSTDECEGSKRTTVHKICKSMLRSTKFESHATWLANKIKNENIALIKFKIASIIPPKNIDELCGILDNIIKELTANPSDYIKIEKIEYPDIKDILGYLENVLKSENINPEKMTELAKHLKKAKTNADIENIINNCVKKNKRKNVSKNLKYFRLLIIDYNNRDMQDTVTEINKKLKSAKQRLTWLNDTQLIELFDLLDEIRSEKDIIHIIDTYAQTKQQKITLLGYMKSDKNQPGNTKNMLNNVTETIILSNRTVLPSKITTDKLDTISELSKEKTPDSITSLRNNISQILSDITEKEIEQKTISKNTQNDLKKEKIKKFCDEHFEKSLSNKISEIIVSMPTKSMIKQTLKYMVRKNIEQIYETIEPIISELPE